LPSGEKAIPVCLLVAVPRVIGEARSLSDEGDSESHVVMATSVSTTAVVPTALRADATMKRAILSPMLLLPHRHLFKMKPGKPTGGDKSTDGVAPPPDSIAGSS
jgi:hypothetical protein